MQKGGNGLFFVKSVLGRKGKDIDAAKLAVGCLVNRPLDGGCCG